MTKEIRLANSKGVALVDDADYEMLSTSSWCLPQKGYARSKRNGKKVYMHRLVMGAVKGQQVDHINGNKLDNRRENLRFCNGSQNRANTGLSKANTTGYKGVMRSRDGYCAKIGHQNKKIYLGAYETAALAADAYDAAARDLYGEFALENRSL